LDLRVESGIAMEEWPMEVEVLGKKGRESDCGAMLAWK